MRLCCNFSGIRFMFATLAFLYFAYGVEYYFLPYSLSTRYLVLGGMGLLAFMYAVHMNSLFKSQLLPLSAAGLFICVSLLSFLSSSSSPDFQMLKISTLYFLMVFSAPLFVKVMFRDAPEDCLAAFGVAGFINALLIIFMLISTEFQKLYTSFLSPSIYAGLGDNVHESMMVLRMVGITGFSAYTTGFIQVVLALLYLLHVKLHFGQPNVRQASLMGVVLISAVLVSRSSIVGIALFALAFFCFFRKRYFFYYFSLAFVFGGLAIFFVAHQLPAAKSDFFMSWALEFFLEGLSTGSVQTNLKMFVYDYANFSLLGESKWFGAAGGYFMSTDVGWYRLLFSVGYIGLVSWLFLIFSVAGCWRVVEVHKNPIAFVALLVVFYSVVMMLKGAILFDFFQGIAILSILSWLSSIYDTRRSSYVS